MNDQTAILIVVGLGAIFCALWFYSGVQKRKYEDERLKRKAELERLKAKAREPKG